MFKGINETLTMSRIDDFVLGENAIRGLVEDPSFVSKN